MKITAVKPLLAAGANRVYVFVKVETDQPGLVGWGEASLEGKPRAVAGCLQDFASMIHGEDPLRTEFLWQLMYRSGFWRQGVIGLSALSGIDQALWDIKGKEFGRPVYELLGGRVRDRVRAYTHFGGGTPEAAAESAVSKKKAGWSAIKTVPVPITGIVEGIPKVKQAAASLNEVRQAVGDEVDILLDLHGRLTPQMAVRYGRAFEEAAPFFLEEPCQAENPRAMAAVREKLDTPIATGERLFTRWGFREILDVNAASILQPDCCHAGGITELMKIASMAEVHYAGIAPHNPYGPVSTAACVHADFAMPNFVIQEMIDPIDNPDVYELVADPLPVSDGWINPPTRPGLGVEVDERAVARCAPDFDSGTAGGLTRRVYGAFHLDGGVADS